MSGPPPHASWARQGRQREALERLAEWGAQRPFILPNPLSPSTCAYVRSFGTTENFQLSIRGYISVTPGCLSHSCVLHVLRAAGTGITSALATLLWAQRVRTGTG